VECPKRNRSTFHHERCALRVVPGTTA
jgi:hypothetical protein